MVLTLYKNTLAGSATHAAEKNQVKCHMAWSSRPATVDDLKWSLSRVETTSEHLRHSRTLLIMVRVQWRAARRLHWPARTLHARATPPSISRRGKGVKNTGILSNDK